MVNTAPINSTAINGSSAATVVDVAVSVQGTASVRVVAWKAWYDAVSMQGTANAAIAAKYALQISGLHVAGTGRAAVATTHFPLVKPPYHRMTRLPREPRVVKVRSNL